MRNLRYWRIKYSGIILVAILLSNCEKEKSDDNLQEKPTEVPTITTVRVNNIYQTSAKVDGSLTSQTTYLKRKGVCLNTLGSPTIEDTYYNSGTSLVTVDFSMQLNELEPGTTYYVRAFAENEIGIGYGQELSFTTNDADIPKIETGSVDHINQTHATCNFSILSDSGSAIISKGVCWSLQTEPTLADSSHNMESQDLNLTYVVSNLNLNTTYYIRAFAINSVGIAYGNILVFNTLPESGEIVLDVEGNEYSTLVIGEQIWLDQNMKTTKLKDCGIIPILTGDQEWSTTSAPAYCWYDNDESNKEDYGALYNAYVVRTDKICPTGWHVPDKADIEILIEFLDENSLSLRDVGYYTMHSGHRNYEGPFSYDEESFDSMSDWWLSSENEQGTNYQFTSGLGIYTGAANNNGYSIRCLKNLP